MNNKHIKQASNILGSIARKVAESAVHAAVFAYVSNKVSALMKKTECKKVRVEEETKKEETANPQ